MKGGIAGFQMSYPSLDHYVIPAGQCPLSPCMSEYWRSKSVRQGLTRDEIDFEEKPEELENEK